MITKDFFHHPRKSLGSVPEAKGKAEELRESKGTVLWNVGKSLGNLEITLLEIKFGKELGAGNSGVEIRKGG